MTETPQQFHEQAYLDANPDVAKAVERGAFVSGEAHYELIGRKSGRPLGDIPVAAPKLKIGEYSLIYQPALLEERLKEAHTFVGSGSPQGGSSLIACILNHQGIDMGAQSSERASSVGDSYEDPVFARSITQQKFDTEAVTAHIAARNAELDVWGVVLPDAIFHLMRLEEMIRNPIFVMIYRNPVSIARNVMQQTTKYEHDAEGLCKAIQDTMGFYDQFSRRLVKLNSPVICIEYEPLRYQSKAALSEILTAIGIDLSNMDDLLNSLESLE